jgi:NADH-quinone oxidoreductase subunit C
LTRFLDGEALAKAIEERTPGSVIKRSESGIWVKPVKILDVCRILKDPSGLDFSYLTSITAIDYVEHFELIYHLLSMRNNYGAVVKTLCPGRNEPSLPSVTGVWQGADLQEREIWDLMGIKFEGHPNLKRILLWEGFDGHPLRKDYLDIQ